MFEFSHLGLILLGIACLYFVWPGRFLLPRRKDESLTERYQIPKFITEVLVEPSSTLINRAVADTELFGRYNISVLGIVRAGGETTGAMSAPWIQRRRRPSWLRLSAGL